MRELINRYTNCYPLEDNYNNDLGPMASLFFSWQTSNVYNGEWATKHGESSFQLLCENICF